MQAYFDDISVTIQGKPDGRIFPASRVLWAAGIYLGLFIIRPWEQLFPWLQVVKFERCYGIAMVIAAASTYGLRLDSTLQNVGVFVLTGSVGLCAVLAQNGDAAWNAYYDLLTVVVCYVVLISVCRSVYDLIFLIACYIAAMELYLAKALWEFYVHGQHVNDVGQGIIRLVGIEDTFGSPNKLAASIVVSMPFCLFLWRSRSAISIDWPRRWQRRFSAALAGYFVLAVWSIGLTNSRSGMTALGVFVLLAQIRKGSFGRILRNFAIAVTVLAVAWLVLPETQKNRFRSIWDPEAGTEAAEASKQGRVEAFQAAAAMFRSHPLSGVGVGNFTEYRVAHVDGVNLSPHSLVGQMIAETGLIGTTGFLFLILGIAVTCFSVMAATRGRYDHTSIVLGFVAQAVLQSLVLLVVEGIAGHNFYRYNWLWLAAFCSLAWRFTCVAPSEQLWANEFVDARSATSGCVTE